MASTEARPSRRSMNRASTGRLLRVPGCGLLIEHEVKEDEQFRHGSLNVKIDRMTVREVSMLGLMEALTDKPSWWKKVFDETITEKWRKEALNMPLITEKTWNWCLTELQDKAREYEVTKLTTVLDMGGRCVKADDLVPKDLQDKLKVGVQPLLDHTPRDWHPGSGDRVLNLVHPSLYPAVYGKTQVLRHKQIGINDCLAPHDYCILLVVPGSDESSQGVFLEPSQAPHQNLGFNLNNDLDEQNAFGPDEGNEDGASILSSIQAESSDDDDFDLSGGNVVDYTFTNFDDDDLLYGMAFSSKYQWLPCDVSFTNDTDNSVKIQSYINNLHPIKYRPLYPIIESLISLSIPAWNQILMNDRAGRTPRRIKVVNTKTEPPEEPEWSRHLDDSTDEAFEASLAKVYEYWKLPDNPENEPFFQGLEDDWRQYLSIGVEWKFRRIRKTIHPEPGVPPSTSFDDWKAGKLSDAIAGEDKYKPEKYRFEYKPVNLRDTFAGTGLQVIVKLASIQLTPQNPSYPGGNWHLEGMGNEHIVATSIYYFDVDNITESRIRFRQDAQLDQTELSYEQGDHAPLCQLFGVDKLRDEPAIQEIGSIATPGGRLLAFPNTLQHKVEPFGLLDSTKPGHRRFLVLWLVDPHYRVLSTANVPPQQHEWWVEKAAEAVYGRVSAEIQAMIEEQLKDGTMTFEEAKAYRLELMAERTIVDDSMHESGREYDFCEH